MPVRLLACLLLVPALTGCLVNRYSADPAAPHETLAAPGRVAAAPRPAVRTAGSGCVVYPLHDLGGGAALARWVAETIPQVIEPHSWSGAGGQGALAYHAPARLLVVYQTPAVQRQVSGFLAGLKRALPAEGAAAPHLAAAPAQPRHLFHLVVRAEGDGQVGAAALDRLQPAAPP